MTDPRWRELAEVLTGHATGVQPGERVLVAIREPETLPLAEAVVEAVIRAGAHPQAIYNAVAFDRALLRHGSRPQIAWEPELESLAIDWADVSIWLRGAHNPFEFLGVTPELLALHRRALGLVSARRTAETRWTLVRVPNAAFAQAAGLPLEETMERFFAASLLDWDAEAAGWRALRDRLAAGSQVRVTGPGTDLRFSTAGRRWVVGDGRINVPDGEIYTAPVDGSAEGTIAFAWPAHFSGRTVERLRLRFHRGAVVELTADRGEEVAREALAMDAGARRLGEVGIGVNRELDRPFGDPLFDEKIFGTVHIALGRAYAECGGVNESALHWDIVKDLRSGGRVEVDGVAVFADGAFVGG